MCKHSVKQKCFLVKQGKLALQAPLKENEGNGLEGAAIYIRFSMFTASISAEGGGPGT